MGKKLPNHDHGSASYDQALNDDHFQSYIDTVQGQKKLKIVTPTEVLRISSRKDLKVALDNFRRERAGLKSVVEDNATARRHYVQSVRPALRYYCAKFQMNVPDWLVNDKNYTELSTQDKIKLFGTDHLKIKEFKKVKIPQLTPGQPNA